MSEFNQGMLGTLGLFICLIFSLLSWFGGRDKNYLGIRARIWKRWIAPIFFSVSVVCLSLVTGTFKWWFTLSIPAYAISTYIGYGGSTLWIKILRRTLWTIFRVMCALTLFNPSPRWISLFLVQLGVALLTTLIIGIKNPVAAAQEEGIINFSSVMFVPFMVV